MSTKLSLRPIVGYLQQLAQRTAIVEASDLQLLERFARDRDEDAFRMLVQRHAPLVYGVCRRALHRHHDAEDCFQATFLVLARKASAVRWHESVGGWLHQTATRLAAELRVRAARRRRHEENAARVPQQVDDGSLRDLATILDEEMLRLPMRCRGPVLLCYLQGQTRDQAAVSLGLSLRTLERRLQAARDLLRARLTRRGVTLSAGLLAWGLAQEAASAVPAPLLGATAEEAAAFVAGQGVSKAAALAGQVVRDMLWQKVRWVAAVLLTTGLAFAMAGFRTGPASAGSDEGLVPAQRVDQAPAVPVVAAGDKAPKPRAAQQEVATAAAVQLALGWLASQQGPDGGWKLDAAQPNDVAATAFGLLPLLQSGEHQDATVRFGSYAETVRRGLKRLASMQNADGGFQGGMYAHALATWALVDGYRLTGDAKLKQPAQAAIDYIVNAQHDGGGWRYAPKQPGDTSVTSWHIVALKRGQQAGLQIPANVLDKAVAYLKSAAVDDGTRYSYVPGGAAPSPAITAAGLMCRQLLDWEPRHPTLLKGVARVKQFGPAANQVNAYFYHFATRLMHAVGGNEWDDWESRLVPLLLARQEPGGPNGGSFSPAGDVFGAQVGRLMVTSLSLMALQPCGQVVLPPAGADRKLKAGEAAECWNDLAANDFAKVKKAMQRLAGDPDQAVLLFRERIKPAPTADAKLVNGLIAGLGSDQFEDRTEAFRALRALGERAAPVLREKLKGKLDLEVRRRVEQLLDEVDRAERAPERLRDLRAVQVLELAGTAEARQLLRALADGPAGARLTTAAKEALDRLK